MSDNIIEALLTLIVPARMAYLTGRVYHRRRQRIRYYTALCVVDNRIHVLLYTGDSGGQGIKYASHLPSRS